MVRQIISIPPQIAKCEKCGARYLIKFGTCLDPFPRIYLISPTKILQLIFYLISGKPYLPFDSEDSERKTEDNLRDYLLVFRCFVCHSHVYVRSPFWRRESVTTQ